MIDEMELEMAVRKGAKVLDEVQPGWAGLVDLDALDMQMGSVLEGQACVMCQMSLRLDLSPDKDGDWTATLENVLSKLPLKPSRTMFMQGRLEWAIEHGFYREPIPGVGVEYELLDELWTEEIRSRQVS